MWIRITLLVFFLSGLILANRPAAAAGAELFGPGDPLDAAQDFGEPGTLRARTAGLNLAVVEQVRQELADGQAPPPVSFNLFPDVQLTAHFSRLEPSSAGGITLAGRIDGNPFAEIHLSQVGASFFASLNTSQGLFRAASSDGLTVRIWQVDPASFPKEDEVVPATFSPVSATVLPDVLTGSATIDDGSRIDVYVGYTTAAKTAAGGLAAIQARIITAIAETNTGYANSGINQRVTLVGSGEYMYDETGFDWYTTLSRWSNPVDAVFGPAHTLRASNKADEMVLLVGNTGYCGLGYLMGYVNPSFSSSSFALVAQNCATGYYSFAHEMGHNMGAMHNRETGGGGGAYNYSYGSWIWIPANNKYSYRTVMAYDTYGYTDVNGNVLNYSAQRVNYWSNPTAYYLGQPTGKDAADPHSANNTLTLNNTAWAAAQFRDGAEPAAPSGLTAVRSGPAAITLNWAAPGADWTRVHIERSPVSSAAWSEIGVLAPGITTYSDSAIPAGVALRYRVLSDNGNGRSVSVEVRTPPAAPAGLAVAGLGPTSARVDWSIDFTSQDTFIVERASSGGSFTVLGSVPGSVFTYTDSSILSGSDYQYRVTAHNTTADAVSSPVNLPAAPGNFHPVYPFPATPQMINLAWVDNSAQETGYRIEISTNGGSSWVPVTTTAPGALVYSYNTGVCGLAAQYRLRAVSGAGQSAPLTTSAVTLPCQPAATAVTGTTLLVLSWPDVAGESGYIVEEWNGSQFVTAYQGLLPANSTRYVMRNLPPQTSVLLRVKALNDAGYIISPEVSATTKRYDFFIPLASK